MTKAHGAPALSSSTDLDVVYTATDLDAGQTEALDWQELYEVDSTAQTIRDGGFRCVALQFPDEMLQDSVRVYQGLRKRLTGEVELYVLADTTYGSCCVDEVAAEHVDADLLVHYGHSCLSPPARLSTLLVLTKRPIDVKYAARSITEHLSESFRSKEVKPKAVRLHFDVGYAWQLENLLEALSASSEVPFNADAIDTACFMRVKAPTEADASSGVNTSCSCRTQEEVHAETSKEAERVSPAPVPALNDECVLYIGPPSLKLTHLIMNHPSTPVFAYCPSRDGASGEITLEATNGNRLLMRRYAAIQKAKDADVFGIVVGTLGIAQYLPLVAQIRKRLRSKLKKVYTICVGKPTPSKLANYQEIEAFVLVACPENSLLLTSPESTRDYLRPIVTPWELEVALEGNFTWQDGWRLDWNDVLAPVTAEDDSGTVEDVRFSDATGKLRTVRKFYGKNDPSELAEQVDSLALTTDRDRDREVSRILGSAAGTHLQNLSFRGLDPRYDQDIASTLTQGRQGVARNYKEDVIL